MEKLRAKRSQYKSFAELAKSIRMSQLVRLIFYRPISSCFYIEICKSSGFF